MACKMQELEGKMELNELKAYQKGLLEGASAQRESTAANVFAFIIDHGELIPEEKCLQMLSDFINDKYFNKINIQKNNKKLNTGGGYQNNQQSQNSGYQNGGNSGGAGSIPDPDIPF